MTLIIYCICFDWFSLTLHCHHILDPEADISTLFAYTLPCASLTRSFMHAYHVVVNMTGMVIKG
jgi:hypothetical protein